MMSHSSGVCVWTSNMTLVCSGHLFCGTQGETQRAESRTRTFGDKESACFGEFSLRFARTFVSTCAGKSCQRPSGQSLERRASASSFRSRPAQFVLNAGGDNYPALARPVLGLWPAETRDASERGMGPLNTTKAKMESKNKKQYAKHSSAVCPRSCESTHKYLIVSHYCFFQQNLRERKASQPANYFK